MSEAERSNRQQDHAVSQLESRMVALEIISMTALAMALDTSDNGDAEHARSIAGLILEAVRHRCTELNLSESTCEAASDYAQQLLGTALVSLFPSRH
jgi:hypothetical protein